MKKTLTITMLLEALKKDSILCDFITYKRNEKKTNEHGSRQKIQVFYRNAVITFEIVKNNYDNSYWLEWVCEGYIYYLRAMYLEKLRIALENAVNGDK